MIRFLAPWRRIRPAPAAPEPGQARRLFVDISVISQQDARTGIQRVVRAVWTHLRDTPIAGVEVIPVFARKRHGYSQADSDFLAGAMASSAPLSLLNPRCGDLFLGLDLAAHLLPRHRKQIRAWRRAGVSINIVVYDLLPMNQPSWFARRTRRNYRRWLTMLARDADRALCISSAVADDLRRWLARRWWQRTDTPAIHAFPLAADLHGSQPSHGLPGDAAALLNDMQTATSTLMVGTVEPRKGHALALDAFEQLWRTSPGTDRRLYIVGRAGWKTEALQQRLLNHSEQGSRLFWLSDVSDEYLEQLYGAASLVLLASAGEGFGLPLIEALAHGCRVLSRDMPAAQTVGDHPNLTLFAGDDAAALADAITRLDRLAPVDHPLTLPGWPDSVAAILDAIGLNSAHPNQKVGHTASRDYAG
jgi:glycosyltransferase involved in cell wall biosynthesis